MTDRALRALEGDGHDLARSVLTIRHVLGCGGTGFRIAMSGLRPADGEGHLVAAGRGLTVWLDDYAFHRLQGAAIDHDDEKETEGYLLDHPDAVLAAFC